MAVDAIKKTTYLTIIFRVLCGVADKTAPGERTTLPAAQNAFPPNFPVHLGNQNVAGVSGVSGLKAQV